MAREPLAGVRVADLTQAWAGSYAAMIVADLGAEVIKIEALRRPDVWRGGLDAYMRGKGTPGNRPYNRNALTNSICRNKLGITLDLGVARGRELFLQLVAACDVVMENFTPRVLNNFGLGYETLVRVRPDLIMLSMPAFGDRGPYSDFPGIGGSIEPMSGNSALLGPGEAPPLNSGEMYPDAVAGMNGAAAVLTALHARSRGAAAQYINLSQHESMITMLGGVLVERSLTGQVARWGDTEPDLVPSRHYRCGDGRFLALTVACDDEWTRLARHIGGESLAGEARFATGDGRRRHGREIDAHVERWCAGRGAAEAERELIGLGLRVGLVRDVPEIAVDPHLRARGAFVTVSHRELGEYETVAPPWRFSGTPVSVRCGPPCLGEHSRRVFHELLGLDDGEIDALEAAGISGETPPAL